MFHEPVDPSVVEGYHSIITKPIDLTTIKAKLSGTSLPSNEPSSSTKSQRITQPYTCDTDVINDLDLMITNALTFNPAGTVWHSHAKTLRKRLYSDFIPMVNGLTIDEEELEYVDKGSKKESTDYSKSLIKEERKKTENLSAVLSGMEADLSIPIEELRKRFAANGSGKKETKLGEKRQREKGEASTSSSSASDGSSEESESSSSSSEGSSSGSGSSGSDGS